MSIPEQHSISALRIPQAVTHPLNCDLGPEGYLWIFGRYDLWSNLSPHAETASFNAPYFS